MDSQNKLWWALSSINNSKVTRGGPIASDWNRYIFLHQKIDPKVRPKQRSSNQWWPTCKNPTNRHSLSMQTNTALPNPQGGSGNNHQPKAEILHKPHSKGSHRAAQLWFQWGQKEVFLPSQKSLQRPTNQTAFASSTGQKCRFILLLLSRATVFQSHFNLPRSSPRYTD